MNEAQMTGIAIGLGVLGALLLIIFLKANIILCQPNELLVLAGRQWRQPEGSKIGYRVIRANAVELLRHPKEEASWC